MKNYLVILWMGLICACTAPQTSNDIEVSFDVTSPTAREAVLVYHRTITSVPLDEQGHGVCKLTGMNALYVKVFYGENQKNVYLENGDKVHITFDGNDFVNTFKMEGEKKLATDYLNNITLTELTDAYSLPFDDFLQKIAEKETDALKILKANQLSKVGRFEKMEEGRIKYSYGSGVLMYPVGHMFYAKDTAYQPDNHYYEEVKKYWVEDEDWLALDEYRALMAEMAHVLDPAHRNENSPYPKAVAQMKYLVDHLQNEKVKETLLHYLAAAYVEQFGIKNIAEMSNLYSTYVKDTALIADYQKKYSQWDLSSPGKPSPDFEAVDSEGKKYTLKDFSGKYIYIDLWATWCGPCKRELPFLKELDQKFAGKNIVFLSLSIDHDKAKWEERVKSGDLSGVQLHIGRGSSFQRAYNIDGIPRFILIDTEGKIINNEMSRPSSPDTERILSELKGI